jgi:hypothetical protein
VSRGEHGTGHVGSERGRGDPGQQAQHQHQPADDLQQADQVHDRDRLGKAEPDELGQLEFGHDELDHAEPHEDGPGGDADDRGDVPRTATDPGAEQAPAYDSGPDALARGAHGDGTMSIMTLPGVGQEPSSQATSKGRVPVRW